MTQQSLLNQTGNDQSVTLFYDRTPNGNKHTVPWLTLLIAIRFGQLQTPAGVGFSGAKEHESPGGG